MIQAQKVSKYYRIYRNPSDRLKELLSLRRKHFHEPFWAVRDVDLEIPRGRCLGIVGENGSGKSTLLRMIAGVVRPTSGVITVNGRVSALLELGAGFNPEFTGRENIFLSASIFGLTDAETRQRIPDIEKFAEIGEFVDRPVKTYSSGMFVRLAFSVAIHLNPDVLVVDEALSVGDYFFQQRCIRRILQLKQDGVTIVFVSHDIEAVRSLADRAIWMEHGSVRFEGKPDEVVAKYMAAMLTRRRRDVAQEQAIGKGLDISSELDITEEARSRMPAFLTSLPNVDHRYGNGKARIRGIGVFGKDGYPLTAVDQGERICVRISVEFLEDVDNPNIGFMLRNRLGQDITATNLMFEGEKLPPGRADERLSIDFILDVPLLQGAYYHLSPAVADGTLDQYEICDWIDNACAIEVVERSTTYGHMRIPMRVRATPVPREASVMTPDLKEDRL
jgi:ABC-type polysaccharide/polyol phosphate transport system ATPase subunit